MLQITQNTVTELLSLLETPIVTRFPLAPRMVDRLGYDNNYWIVLFFGKTSLYFKEIS